MKNYWVVLFICGVIGMCAWRLFVNIHDAQYAWAGLFVGVILLNGVNLYRIAKID